MTSQRSLLLQSVCTAATLTSLYSQFMISIAMSQSSRPPRNPNTFWSEEETEALLKHLLENQLKDKGAGSFNNTIFQSVVTAVQPFYTKGAVKDIKHMKGKWQLVSI